MGNSIESAESGTLSHYRQILPTRSLTIQFNLSNQYGQVDLWRKVALAQLSIQYGTINSLFVDKAHYEVTVVNRVNNDCPTNAFSGLQRIDQTGQWLHLVWYRRGNYNHINCKWWDYHQLYSLSLTEFKCRTMHGDKASGWITFYWFHLKNSTIICWKKRHSIKPRSSYKNADTITSTFSWMHLISVNMPCSH